MLRCSACSGFAPSAATSCPNCGADLPRPTSRLAKAGGIASTLLGSAFTMTLMACYGCPANECTGIPYDDAGRVRSDAQVNVDSGLGEDASGGNDAGTGSDAGSLDGASDAGDQGDASFDAAPE